MTFDTTNITPPNFTVPVVPSLTGGKHKLAVSMWLRWTGRASDYGALFGSSFNSGADTYAFLVRWSGASRLWFQVGLNNGGTRWQPTTLTTGYTAGAGIWNHWLFQYDDSLSTQLLKCYLNGDLDSSITPTILGLPLWTNPSAFNLGLWGSSVAAATVDFGELTVYAGDTIPSQSEWSTYRSAGTLPAGSVLWYPNVGSGVVSSIPESVGGYALGGSGSGTLTSEQAGLAPCLRIKAASCYILPSGESVHTEWETDGGTAIAVATKAASLFPTCRLQPFGGAYGASVEMSYRVMKTNAVRWVIPAACRPTSSGDVLEVTFPEGLIRPSEAQFSHASVETPTNNYGTIRYALPDAPRAKIVENGGSANYATPAYTIHNMGAILGNWLSYRNTVLDDRGIPTENTGWPNNACYASLYAWAVAGPTGNVYLLYRGIGAHATLHASGIDFPVVAEDTVDYGGYTWVRKTYALTGSSPSVRVSTDASAMTNLDDLLVVKAEHWDAFASGNVMTSQWLVSYRSVSTLRWMDANFVLTGNAWDVSHVVPEDYASLNRSTEVSGTIVSIESTTDPDGWFGSGGRYKITFASPHNFRDGQTVLFRGSTAAYADGTLLNSCTGRIRVTVPGYTTSQAEVRISKSGTITNVAGGQMYATVAHLPKPSYVAALHNELYAAYGRCDTYWGCIPPSATDELVTAYVSAIHALLGAGIKMRLEYANETYNSASEGIWRYCMGMGILAGQTSSNAVNWFTAHRTYEIYKLIRAACPGRDIGVVLGGQSVSPSVLSARMAYYYAEWAADTDPGKGTWEEHVLWMSVSTYHDPPDTSSTTATGIVNQAGIPQLGAEGISELWDFGFRDHAAYASLIASHGKQMWAYEGGAYVETPSNMPSLTRAMFAGQMAPGIIQQTYENFRRAQAAGFSGVCPLPIPGEAKEQQGKWWALVTNFAQIAGIGDGSDGLYDNVGNATANLSHYRADGSTGYLSFVSPKLYALEAWAGTGEAPPAPPPTPTGLVADAVSTSQINLTWNNVVGETGYLIYSSTDDVSYTLIGMVTADVTSFSATGLLPSTLYYFKVLATGAANSAMSDAASDTSEADPPVTTVMGFRSPFPWAFGMSGSHYYEIDGVPNATAFIRPTATAFARMRPSVSASARTSPSATATARIHQ